MGKGRRTALVGIYLLGSALVFYFYSEDRGAQGEFGSVGDDWVNLALFVSSVAVGALIGRLRVLLLPLCTPLIGWPIAWSIADGHALADMLIWVTLEAILNTAAAGAGVGVRRFASRVAGPS